MDTLNSLAGENGSLLSREEVAQRAAALYEQGIRAQVESGANIGKLVVIDVGSGDFAVDEFGFEAAHTLRERHPNARLFALRIGYNVAASFGGLMERTAL